MVNQQQKRMTRAPKRSRPDSWSDSYSDVDDLMLFSEDEQDRYDDETEVKIVIESPEQVEGQDINNNDHEEVIERIMMKSN